MERKVLVVCTVVGFLGVLSAVLGFAAEGKKIKASDAKSSSGECTFPKSAAFGLGVASIVALIMAIVINNAFAGCICCKKPRHFSGTNWIVGLISFILSWIAFVLAFILLLVGALTNHPDVQASFESCYGLKPGVFSGGALLSLASVSFGIIYYLKLSSSKRLETQGGRQNQGIALGDPPIPQQSAEPVFVHEDINRKQFP